MQNASLGQDPTPFIESSTRAAYTLTYTHIPAIYGQGDIISQRSGGAPLYLFTFHCPDDMLGM